MTNTIKIIVAIPIVLLILFFVYLFLRVTFTAIFKSFFEEKRKGKSLCQLQGGRQKKEEKH